MAVNGHAELYAFRKQRKDDVIFITHSKEESGFSVYSAASDYTTEKLLSRNLQSIGSNILCGEGNKTVVAALPGGRKGKFSVLEIMVPLKCSLSVRFSGDLDDHSVITDPTHLWPFSSSAQETCMDTNDAPHGGSFNFLGIKQLV